MPELEKVQGMALEQGRDKEGNEWRNKRYAEQEDVVNVRI